MKGPRLVLFVVSMGIIASGCVVDEASLLIVGNNVVKPADCVVEATEEGPFQGGGILDVSMASSYVFTPSVKNSLSPSSSVEITPGSKAQLSDALIEGNTILLQGAEVSFTVPANSGLVLPQSLFIPTAGTISPQSLAGISLEIMNSAMVAQLRSSPIFAARGPGPQVIVSIKILGTTVSGRDVESLEFTYPLQLCSGCLVSWPAGSTTGGICDSSVPTEDQDAPCNIGQDDLVDCRFCMMLLGNDPICQP